MSGETPLSDREMDVLRLVAEGLTNREIAQKLSISHNTVKVHLSNIFEKVGVASRTEATVYAIEHRIVSVPGGEAAAAPAQQGLRDLIRQFRWVWLAILVLLVLIGMTLTTNLLTREAAPETIATVDVSERWQELAPMPEPRTGMAAVAYGGNIYVIGGMGPEGVSGKGFRYIPETNEWQTIAEKPTPVSDVEAVVIGEKIYVPGGILASGQLTDILEIYDPRQNTWEQGTNLPIAVSAYALADFEGKMYLFGGWDGNYPISSIWIYDPSFKSWIAGTKMDEARYDAKAIALYDDIILLGGDNGSEILSGNLAYIPARDIPGESPWEPFINFPDKRFDFGVIFLNNSIYVLGGMDGEDTQQEDSYILIDNQWEVFHFQNTVEFFDPKLMLINTTLYVLTSSPQIWTTDLWSYEMIYYNIFIPIVP